MKQELVFANNFFSVKMEFSIIFPAAMRAPSLHVNLVTALPNWLNFIQFAGPYFKRTIFQDKITK